MKIRNVKLEDYDKIRELVFQVHAIHLAARPDIYEDGDFLPLDYFKECIKSENSVNIVCEEENEICGLLMATVQAPRNLPIIKPRKIYFIEDIVVDKKHRKKGIAKKLFEYLKDLAINDSADSIELNVWSFNEEALNFYQAIGMSVKNMRLETHLKTEDVETNEIKMKTTFKTKN